MFLSTVGSKAPTIHHNSTEACKIAVWVPAAKELMLKLQQKVSKKPPSEPIDIESLQLSSKGQQAKADETWIHTELYCLLQSEISS